MLIIILLANCTERISLPCIEGGGGNIVESALSFYEASEVAGGCWLLGRYTHELFYLCNLELFYNIPHCPCYFIKITMIDNTFHDEFC